MQPLMWQSGLTNWNTEKIVRGAAMKKSRSYLKGYYRYFNDSGATFYMLQYEFEPQVITAEPAETSVVRQNRLK